MYKDESESRTKRGKYSALYCQAICNLTRDFSFLSRSSYCSWESLYNSVAGKLYYIPLGNIVYFPATPAGVLEHTERSAECGNEKDGGFVVTKIVRNQMSTNEILRELVS